MGTSRHHATTPGSGSTGSSPRGERARIRPLPGEITPSQDGGLPVRPLRDTRPHGCRPAWWFLSCHGGAGGSTLHAAVPGGLDAGRYWPIPDPPAHSNVVLVARSHASGLRAAQQAARQWAAGMVPTVHLLGLAVIADAPGRHPRPLRDLLHLVSGGVPRVWDLPWVEALRLGDPVEQVALPAPYATFAADLQTIVLGGAHV